MNSLWFVYLALLIFILSIRLVLSSVIIPRSCKAALAITAAALSDILILSAMEVTHGILHIWELFSTFSFEKPDRFIISCIFKGLGSSGSFGKENCCFSEPVIVASNFFWYTSIFFFLFFIKLNYFLYSLLFLVYFFFKMLVVAMSISPIAIFLSEL